jgi:hypothetical protein
MRRAPSTPFFRLSALITQGQSCMLGLHWCTSAIILHRGAHQPTVLSASLTVLRIERSKSQLVATPSLCHGDRRSTVLGLPQHRRPRGSIGRIRGGGRRRGALGASLGRERLRSAPPPKRRTTGRSVAERSHRHKAGSRLCGVTVEVWPSGQCAQGAYTGYPTPWHNTMAQHPHATRADERAHHDA